VRETYAALLASHQAEYATDPGVRAAMARIARDETRHAALSWRVARWLEQRLTPAAKRKVMRARQAAASELLAAITAQRAELFADSVGLPKPGAALALATEMKQALWS
jgi:rubrerythrin